MMRFTVDAWDPQSIGGESLVGLPESDAKVDPAVELPEASWRPIPPSRETAAEVAFIDGVRRIDARIWIADPASGRTVPGLCASYAAGAVVAAERASVESVVVERALVTAEDVSHLDTSVGRFHLLRHLGTSGGDDDPLVSRAQTALRDLESTLAVKADVAGRLVVLDGPISERHRATGVLGYVKSHRVRYLPERLEPVALALAPGERTPLFATTTSWQRYSSYAKLPTEDDHPWAGIVRLEVSGDRSPAEATALVSMAAATLPRFASTRIADPRAPANLFPIGGLERELKRRLGDAGLVFRALRRAATN